MTFNEFVLNTNLHDIDLLSVILRLALAVVFGGIIGLNRAKSHHAAGFRTHVLVCIGAALVMMTNQYMIVGLGYDTDPARLGAQVITGVGFLGAGTIFVNKDKTVFGLTTAAGLWASACMGLAIGIGFYGAAICGGICIYLCLSVFLKIIVRFYRHVDEETADAYEQRHKDEM